MTNSVEKKDCNTNEHKKTNNLIVKLNSPSHFYNLANTHQKKKINDWNGIIAFFSATNFVCVRIKVNFYENACDRMQIRTFPFFTNKNATWIKIATDAECWLHRVGKVSLLLNWWLMLHFYLHQKSNCTVETTIFHVASFVISNQ